MAMESLIEVVDHVFVPLTGIIIALSVIGILGNILAFYVFNVRSQKSGFNRLLASLAVIDIFACVVQMPLDIVTFLDIGDIRSDLCKLTCFQLAFTASSGAVILMGIAVVRYRGIHNPFEGPISNRKANYIIIISVICSTIIASPIIVPFGDGEFMSDKNMTAKICAIEEAFHDSRWPLIYYSSLVCTYGVTFVLHTCLYAKSVYTIWGRRKTFQSMTYSDSRVKMTQRNYHRSISNESSTFSVAVTEMSLEPIPTIHTEPNRNPANPLQVDHNPLPNLNYIIQGLKEDDGCQSQRNTETRCKPFDEHKEVKSERTENLRNMQSQNNDALLSPIGTDNSNGNVCGLSPTSNLGNKQKGSDTATNFNVKTSFKINERKHESQHRHISKENSRSSSTTNQSFQQTSYRVLGVAISISVCYFLSYAPHFGVMFYLFNNDKDVFAASVQNLAFEIAMRSFYLNNVLDPFLYGLFSQEFRRVLMKSLRRDSH